jgi:regulator of protease activity HflC (stomatin/prohibitin superfamily)
VLKGRFAIRRIVGPGATFTREDESIHSILDLRPQLRSTSIQAITRDGIKVNVALTLVFQIDPGRRTIHLTHPWPHARDGVWRIAFAAEVNPDGHTPTEPHVSQPWHNLPLEVVRNVLPQIIIAYTLDELYGAASGAATQRQRIGARLQRKLARQLAPLGIQVDGCTLGLITPVEAEVTQQRIEAWKARWITQLMAWQGEAQALRFRNFAAIHSQAQVDLLVQVMQPTSTTPQPLGDDIERNLLAHHLLENLERIAREPEIQTFLPESAVPILTSLRERLKDTTS